MNDFIFNESDCGCVIQASRTMTVFPGTKEAFTLAPQQMLLLPGRYDVQFSGGAMVQVLHLSRDIVSDFWQYIVTDKGLSTVTPRNTPDLDFLYSNLLLMAL
ncbi:hypothetical protein J3704_004706 [Salmonella enterica subsp. diarizonae serovar 61:z52:z53]|nr:hypothetical protein [Salmonella enterica subsp. diarizonae serovar 61:z52:z53]EHG6221595.1 hypothetical protein [Salmonella enterica subsp. diarizonae serovar 61:z52:z53]